MLSNLKPPSFGCIPPVVDPKFTAALNAFFAPFKGLRMACESMRIAPTLPLRKPRPPLLPRMLAELDRLRSVDGDMVHLGRPPVS